MSFLVFGIWHLVIYAMLRVIFFIWHGAELQTLTLAELSFAFGQGLRFDLAALASLFGICCLGLIWLGRYRAILLSGV